MHFILLMLPLIFRSKVLLYSKRAAHYAQIVEQIVQCMESDSSLIQFWSLLSWFVTLIPAENTSNSCQIQSLEFSPAVNMPNSWCMLLGTTVGKHNLCFLVIIPLKSHRFCIGNTNFSLKSIVDETFFSAVFTYSTTGFIRDLFSEIPQLSEGWSRQGECPWLQAAPVVLTSGLCLLFSTTFCQASSRSMLGGWLVEGFSGTCSHLLMVPWWHSIKKQDEFCVLKQQRNFVLKGHLRPYLTHNCS